MASQTRAEFTVKDAYSYNHRSPVRWIISHMLRYRAFFFLGALCYLSAYTCFSLSRYLLGVAAEEIINPTRPDGLLLISLLILAVSLGDGLSALSGSLSLETLAQRLARDSRLELYTSLLAKSQTFHNQQRVGDIMARSTDDINQMNMMINPGIIFIMDTVLGISVPLLMLATIRLELLLVPLLFVASYAASAREYAARLTPVIDAQREAFGTMNASLEETISGIEVVKATAREDFERQKFRRYAREYRNWVAKQGQTEATYLPNLFFAIAFGFTFLHCLLLNQSGLLSAAEVISAMSLMTVLRWPVQVSVFSWSLVQQGVSGAGRVLKIIKSEAEMDENKAGYAAPIQGDIRFEGVSFGFEDGGVLYDIDLHIQAGETVAIVGQTGSGKSTLTELINRTYDAQTGRVLVDGVDVRDWSLDSLRSQIGRIEQDVFLFSRSIADNIAFGAPNATRAEIEAAAREAQAAGVRIDALGFGTPLGGIIPIRDAQGVVTDYKKDASGALVETRRDDATLATISQITGGTYTPYEPGTSLQPLIDTINSAQQGERAGRLIVRPTERFGIFVALAILALGIEVFLPDSRPNRSRRPTYEPRS